MDFLSNFLEFIDNIQHKSGDTNVLSVLKMLKTSAFTSAREQSTKYGIIITDSGSNSDKTSEIMQEADKVRAAGIKLVTVGLNVDDRLSEKDLAHIADDPDEIFLFTSPHGQDFNSIPAQLAQVVCPSSSKLTS